MVEKSFKLVAPYCVQSVENASIDEVLDYLSRVSTIALDCETRPSIGFDELILLQIADKHSCYAIDVRHLDDTTLCKIGKLLNDKTLIGVNLKYDLKVLYKNIPSLNYEGSLYDLMIVDQVMYSSEVESSSLASLMHRHLGISTYLPKKFGRKKVTTLSLFPSYSITKDIREEFLKIEDEPFSLEQITYAAYDAIYSYKIYEVLSKKVSLLNRNLKTIEIENEFIKVLVDMEINGMPVDRTIWKSITDDLKVQLDKAYAKLVELADINWNSPSQVLNYFKSIGVLDKDATSVSEKVLTKLVSSSEELQKYFEYKHLFKVYSTNGIKFMKYFDSDDRIRSDYWQLVITGRMRSSNPNLQNIPRKYFREGFRAKDGNKLVICDYSGQEARILIEFSDDEDFIRKTNEGLDIHSYVASKIFSKPLEEVTKEERSIAKVINFTIAYGGGPSTVGSRLNISTKQAKSLIDTYFNTFPKVLEYFEKKYLDSISDGYVCEMPVDKHLYRNIKVEFFDELKKLKDFITKWHRFGWKDDIPHEVIRNYNRLDSEFRRKCQNYPIQATAASMTKLACVYLRSRLNKLVSEGVIKFYKLCLVIHDEIIVETSNADAPIVSSVVKQCMEQAGAAFCSKIVMKAEPIISQSWTK